MARQTAGRILPGGLVVPPAPKVFLGADDSWNFTGNSTACSPSSNPHAGIEEACMLGRRMAFHRRHYPFGNGPSGTPPKFSWPTSKETADVALTSPKCVPWITHGSQGGGNTGFPVKTAGGGYSNTTGYTTGGTTYHGIDVITQGKFDSAYSDAFTRMKNLNSPVFFDLWQEMNIPAMGAYGGYQGGTGGAGQSAFIAAWRHLHALAGTAGASNIIWVWNPSQFDPDNNKLTYYPGDSYVDIVALDLYRHHFSGNVDDAYNFAVSHSKPFMIAESGFAALPANNNPTSQKSAMVTELHSSILLPTYVETIGVLPWNFPGNVDSDLIDVAWSSTGVIDSANSKAALTAYQSMASDSAFDVYYGGGTQPPPPTTDSAPLNSVPPSLSDTSPATGELISVVDGQWTGSPTPVLASTVQEAGNTASAQLTPLCAFGFSQF